MSIDESLLSTVATETPKPNDSKPTPDDIKMALDKEIDEGRIILPLMKRSQKNEDDPEYKKQQEAIELEKQCFLACIVEHVYDSGDKIGAAAEKQKRELFSQLKPFYEETNQGRYFLAQQEQIFKDMAEDFAERVLNIRNEHRPTYRDIVTQGGLNFVRGH